MNFHGGEPFLNFEIMKYLTENLVSKNANIQIGFTTNGTVWNEDIKKFLIKYRKNFECGVSVSIDGNEKIHDLNRISKNNEGSYKVVVKTIDELTQIFDFVRGRMTVTAGTAEYISESVTHLFELGLNPISHAFDLKDKNWNMDILKKIENEYDKVFKFWKVNKNINISYIDEIRYKKCIGRCVCSPNIYIDGDIYPCMEVTGNDKYKIGNIKNGLDNDIIDNMNTKFRMDNLFCEKCNNKKMCIHNRCKLINDSINGNLFKPSEFGCAMERVKLSVFNKYKKYGLIDE